MTSTGTVIDTTVTDANGAYEFVDLAAGTYSIRIPVDQAGSADPTTLDFLLPSSNGIVTDADAVLEDDGQTNGQTGFVDAIVQSSQFVLGDPGGDPFAADEPVTESDDAGWANGGTEQSDFTLDFGFYQTYRIGNLVWEDYNNNGVADPGEPGLAGVTVELYDGAVGGRGHVFER